MRRWVVLMLALTVGCTPGGTATAPDPVPSTTLAPATTTTDTSSTTTTTDTTTTDTTTEPEPSGPVVVVMPTGLPADAIDIITSVPGVGLAALIRSGPMELRSSHDAGGTPVDEPPPGFVIPIEAIVFDTASSAEIFSPELAEALGAVGTEELLLSESSAELRRLGPGATMTFADGSSFRVAGIAPDAVAGSSEAIFVGADSAALPPERRRAAVVAYDRDVERLERALIPRFDEPLRVFGRRGGDGGDRQRATLSQIAVKQAFGEFAYRRRSGGRVEIDPAWTDANLVTTEIPLLGEIKCHRRFAAMLAEVMTGLEDDGLHDVIDAGAYQGCWNPRFIAGSGRLSRHSWGIAADINFGNALDGGPGSPISEELLDRMEAAGATSGHTWTTPDPGHFEYLG